MSKDRLPSTEASWAQGSASLREPERLEGELDRGAAVSRRPFGMRRRRTRARLACVADSVDALAVAVAAVAEAAPAT